MMSSLLNLGLTASNCEGLDLDKFARLHRPVGDICLYGLKDLTNATLQAYGRAERVTEGKYRSRYKPEMLEIPLIKFCTETKFMPKNKANFDKAVKKVQKKFCRGLVEPISLETSYEILMEDKSDHFAGLPTLGSKKDDTEALRRAQQCWVGKCPPPPVIGHRGKNTEVARPVWMFPFEWHIVENAFYSPLYRLISTTQTIYPVGRISDRRYHMRKLDQEKGFTTKFSVDFSGYDGSLTSQMIGIAFDTLRKMLKMDTKQGKVFDRVQTFFTTCPFLAPDGQVYKGRKGGVPSGSMFTQLIDSICNAISIEYSMLQMGVTQYRYFVYGDDSWIICRTEKAPLAFLEEYEAHVGSLGLKMNVDKTEYAAPGTPIIFCGHYDIVRGRPLQDAIDKMCYPERPSEAYRSVEGLAERVIAYIADSDLMELNAVYLSLMAKSKPSQLIERAIDMNLIDVLDRGLRTVKHTRHLPGILQVVQFDPKVGGSLMKIRASV